MLGASRMTPEAGRSVTKKVARPSRSLRTPVVAAKMRWLRPGLTSVVMCVECLYGRTGSVQSPALREVLTSATSGERPHSPKVPLGSAGHKRWPGCSGKIGRADEDAALVCGPGSAGSSIFRL